MSLVENPTLNCKISLYKWTGSINRLFEADNMVSQIYPSGLQLNKANTSDTEAAFFDLHLSISNDIVSTKIYD